MSNFQDFLNELARKERNPERRQRREEWIAAVSRLLEQIRIWLKESDPEGLLDVLPLQVQRSEPSLGVYTVPSLKIGMGKVSVIVDPIGRDALGVFQPRGQEQIRAAGRVDLTDGVHSYILYRALSEGKETWYALDEHFKPSVLDRGQLETILQDLLS